VTENQINDINIMMGRVDALHAFCAVIARSLPPPIASTAYNQISTAIPKINADLLAAPVSDHRIDEMLRVLGELQGVLLQAQPQQ
jgi:hypothetical protein